MTTSGRPVSAASRRRVSAADSTVVALIGPLLPAVSAWKSPSSFPTRKV
jgi:hypothetical protein